MNENYIFAATIDQMKSTAWFNPQFYHSLPLSLNTLNRAILKQVAGVEHDMFLTNKPFWLRREDESLNEAKARRVSEIRNILITINKKFYYFVGKKLKSRCNLSHNDDLLCASSILARNFYRFLHKRKPKSGKAAAIHQWHQWDCLLAHFSSL
jgi:hypothetical protein